MTVFRQYYPPHFDVNGRELRINQRAAGWMSTHTAFTRTFPMAGGTINYKTDPNWAPVDFPDNDGIAPVSGFMGDGLDAPTFYVMTPSRFRSLTLTDQKSLRASVTGGGDPLPASVAAPSIVIPLPASSMLSVTTTVSMGPVINGMIAWMGIYRFLPSGNPLRECVASWISTSKTHVVEGVFLYDNGYSHIEFLDSYINSAGICSRTYRMDILGPNAAIYGNDLGYPDPTTFLEGRTTATQPTDHGYAFVLSLGQTGTGYFEISNLSITCTRSQI